MIICATQPRWKNARWRVVVRLEGRERRRLLERHRACARPEGERARERDREIEDGRENADPHSRNARYSGGIARNCCTLSASFPDCSNTVILFPFLLLLLLYQFADRVQGRACTRYISRARAGANERFADGHAYLRSHLPSLPPFVLLRCCRLLGVERSTDSGSRYIGHPVRRLERVSVMIFRKWKCRRFNIKSEQKLDWILICNLSNT